MMYVKHFVTCKALCTCVGDCSHYGHYYLTMGVGLLKGSPWGQGWGQTLGRPGRAARSRDLERLLLEQRPRPALSAEPSPDSGESWVGEWGPLY